MEQLIRMPDPLRPYAFNPASVFRLPKARAWEKTQIEMTSPISLLLAGWSTTQQSPTTMQVSTGLAIQHLALSAERLQKVCQRSHDRTADPTLLDSSSVQQHTVAFSSRMQDVQRHVPPSWACRIMSHLPRTSSFSDATSRPQSSAKTI